MPSLGLQMSLAASRGMLADNKANALVTLKAIPNYLATFDSRESATVLNSTGPDVAATAGQTVARWNSLDNAAVYFSQSNAGKRPTLNANGGVGNTTSGQRLTGTGFSGSTSARTALVVYRNPDTGDAKLMDSPNGSFASTSVNLTVMRISAANGGGTLQTIATVIGTETDRIALVRKSGTSMTAISSITRTFGTAASSLVTNETGLNLFSFGVTDSTAAKQNILGLVVYDRHLSDDECQVALDNAHLYFGKNTLLQTVPVYDIWGQSNAGGYGSTTGITAYDGLDPESTFMVSANDLRKYDFGVNQNFGSADATTSQFGAESELLRLAKNAGSPAAAVIKYSVGSTSLAVEWNPTTPGAQYTEAFVRASGGRRVMQSRGLQVQSKGLLWIQGERDSATSIATSQATYESLLTTLIANYRATYGANLPVAIAKLKITAANYTNLAAIQAAQVAVVAAVGNATLIDTTSDVNFPLQGDGLHFDATAQINIGAAAYAFFNP